MFGYWGCLRFVVAALLLLSGVFLLPHEWPLPAGPAYLVPPTQSSLPSVESPAFANLFDNQALWINSSGIKQVVERLIVGSTVSMDLTCGSSGQHGDSIFAVAHNTQGEQQLLQITLQHDIRPNAFSMPQSTDGSQPAQILLTTGLINSINNVEGLAFVLAHELAHIDYDFFPLQLPPALLTTEQQDHIAATHRTWEYAADRLAIQRMRQAGYNSNGARAVLTALSSWEPAYEQQPNHPRIADRLEAINENPDLSKTSDQQFLRNYPNS